MEEGEKSLEVRHISIISYISVYLFIIFALSFIVFG